MSWGQESQKREEELRAAAEYGRRAEPLPDIHIHSVLTQADAEYGEELRDRRARQEHLDREIVALSRRLSAPMKEDAASPRRGWFRRNAKAEGE